MWWWWSGAVQFKGVSGSPEIPRNFKFGFFVLFITTYSTHHFNNFSNRGGVGWGWWSYISIVTTPQRRHELCAWWWGEGGGGSGTQKTSTGHHVSEMRLKQYWSSTVLMHLGHEYNNLNTGAKKMKAFCSSTTS